MTAARVTLALSIAVLLVAVVGLRSLTMAVPVPPDRSAALALVLDPDTRYGSPGSGRDRAVALARVCALRVEADVPAGAVHDLPDERLLVLVSPAVQGADQDELRGCIEDLQLRRMLVDVEEMRQVPLEVAT